MEKYSNHRDLLKLVDGVEDRNREVYAALNDAFKNQIEEKTVKFICFGSMTVEELSEAFYRYPIIIKSILATVNVATRAIKRDLDLVYDPYSNSISKEKANFIAAYIKPILPNELSIPAICEIDRHFYVDKEIRKYKGSWEAEIINSLNDIFSREFRKRKFNCDGQNYELDGASPVDGDIHIGIDVKRIEARQDTHKRADEIVNKAEKFKKVYPRGEFYTIVYYPFTHDHLNLQNRLKSQYIDGVYFATESKESIAQAVRYIEGKTEL